MAEKINIGMLRSLCADSSTAFAGAREASHQLREAELRLRAAKAALAELSSYYGSKEERAALEHQVAVAQRDRDVASARCDDAHERTALAGRLAENARNYAASIGALPKDLKDI